MEDDMLYIKDRQTARVIVAHPNTQHSSYLAVGVYRAGMLEAYLTQFYMYRERPLYRNMWNIIRNSRISIHFDNRYQSLLPEAKIETIDTQHELLYIVLNRFKLGTRKWRTKILLDQVQTFSKKAGKIAARRADIVIGTDEASSKMFRLAKDAGVICVLDQSSVHQRTVQQIYQEESLVNPVFARTMDYLQQDDDKLAAATEEIELADYFFVGSSMLKQSLKVLGISEDRIFVIPYGVNTTQFIPRQLKSSHKDGPMEILFAGNGAQLKGLSYLLEAVHQLRRSLNIRLVLVGPVDPIILKHTKYKGDYEAVGRVAHSQISEYYQRADVFVLPSLFEGFPRVIVEAMASGIPIIASVNTGAQDAITNGVEGFIVPIRDPDAIKEKLTFLYENPAARIEMGIRARERAIKFFTWERYYQDVGTALLSIWHDRKTQS